MAGILDNKKRIMDTIVTQEGKRQLASGQFQIKYASFTDASTFYEGDIEAGCTDATRRISFEAANRYQDNIVFETDDSGNMLSFQGSNVQLTPEGSVLLSSDGTSAPSIVVESSAFSSAVSSLTGASLESFYDLNIITSEDSGLVKKSWDEGGFHIKSRASDFFTIDGPRRFTSGHTHGTLEESSAFILDEKLSNIDNFKFLPPVNYNDGSPNGEYSNYNDTRDGKEQSDIKLWGEIRNKENKLIRLKNASKANNSMIQVFETSETDTKVTKLDMINYGQLNILGSVFNVIFIGKVFIDKYNQPTFINMFTIALEND